MVSQTARVAQATHPNLHRLSQRVRYHALHETDAAFALPLGAEVRSRLPQPLRHAVESRQREFLAGRLCAEFALRCLGAASTHVAMAADRAPVWPDAGLGIDSEWIIDPAAARDIADVCMVDEAALFKPDDGRSFCEFCTFVFSAKEAVYKCLFPLTRKFLEFSDVRIISFDWYRHDFAWTAISEHTGIGRLSLADGLVHTSVEWPPPGIAALSPGQ